MDSRLEARAARSRRVAGDVDLSFAGAFPGASMRHYVAYHNAERMGRSLHEGDPLGLLTNKPVQPLLNNVVWFVVGDGVAPKGYTLGSVFIVDRVGESAEEEFERYARGRGHVFQPPPVLNDLDWFPEFFKDMAHFSLGVQEIKEPRFIEGLFNLAAQAGYRLGQ